MDNRCRILTSKVSEPTQLTLKRSAQMSPFNTLVQTPQSPFFLMPSIALGILNLRSGELHLIPTEARVTLRMPD